MASKPKPWAVIVSAASAPIRTEHRSQAEAYRRVAAVKEMARTGVSRVRSIRVEQWEPDYNRWATYELIDPKES